MGPWRQVAADLTAVAKTTDQSVFIYRFSTKLPYYISQSMFYGLVTIPELEGKSDS